MSKEDERIMILRFSDEEELRDFFDLFQESGLGSLVKVGDDSDYHNNKQKDGKETTWSKWGLENLDEKSSEKPSLI